jgi:diphosphomevalonate decarboxylase
MQGTAVAQPNIALIKYWGKRDIERNLPAVGSISITLRELYSRMHVELDDTLDADTLTVNDVPDDRMLPRLSACLDRVAGKDRPRARILNRTIVVDSRTRKPRRPGIRLGCSILAGRLRRAQEQE